MRERPPLAGHGAEAVRDAIAASITTLPEQIRRSLTWDFGAEMAQHAQLRIDTEAWPSTSATSHRDLSWQRGTNENTNGLLRQYFPKGTDLSKHTADDLTFRRGRSQRPSPQDPRLANPGGDPGRSLTTVEPELHRSGPPLRFYDLRSLEDSLGVGRDQEHPLSGSRRPR